VNLTMVTQSEVDGRWLGEIPELPGVFAYGTNRNDASLKIQALALRVLAERLEAGEIAPGSLARVTFSNGDAASGRVL
jgi:predicted RNase H-like HicB family nuclease